MALNQKLVASLRSQLHEEGIELKYLDHTKIHEADLILIVRGVTSSVELRHTITTEYRSKAIVLIKPAKIWGLFQIEGKLERLEKEIRNLGYPHVLAGKNNEELAAFALCIIQEYFL